ncbi:general stress protein [Sporosarcina sp. ACRSM]|uniref:general stress protein n=1 Tax=Sporosarcina sp. ACRSM TaxID=2918216 RepID=UPI001EF5427A|nr:general stress protein [Sporosarcina sp. ACRSM]MCG7334796.1 general stress protein [Sporosarcina sp. ACRSM]
MAMKKHVGTFHSIDTVLYKITELGSKGYVENQIYGVSGVDDMIAMLEGETEIMLQGGNGEERVRDIFRRMGFSEQQAEAYFEEVKDGGVALFVEDEHTDSNGMQEEMDSSAEVGFSGEQLDGQDREQQLIENTETVPRIDTKNL